MESRSFTELINLGRGGDSIALNLAYNAAFGPLRRTAARLLQREGACYTLQPTALVAELYLRLHRLQCRILNREHFYGLAARSMKRYLIDHGRAKAVRRRREPELVFASAVTAQPESAARMATRHAWERLRNLDPVAAEAVWLLKAEGMTISEVASRQKRLVWRVLADCDFALGWLAKRLS